MRNTALILLLLSIPLALIAEDQVVSESAMKTLAWPDGTKYVGGVEDGKRTGRGTIFWQDGTRFVGEFRNDMRNGPGTMILPEGTVYTGYFKDDELVNSPAASTIAVAEPEAVTEPEAVAVAETEDSSTETQAVDDTDPTHSPVVVAHDSQPAAIKIPVEKPQPEPIEKAAEPEPASPEPEESMTADIGEANLVDVFFKQKYQSNLYRDVTNKILRLQEEENAWKIVLEKSK